MTWKLSWGLCSERKGGNLECNKLLSDGKAKRVNGNGNGIEFFSEMSCVTLAVRPFWDINQIPRESAFEKSLITLMPLLFYRYLLQKF